MKSIYKVTFWDNKSGLLGIHFSGESFSDIEKQSEAVRRQIDKDIQIVKIENLSFDARFNLPFEQLQKNIQEEVEKQLLNRGIASKGYVKTEVALAHQSEQKQIKKLFSEIDKLKADFSQERKRIWQQIVKFSNRFDPFIKYGSGG